MTISILGCGWYGLPLAKALVSEGHRVKGSTTSADKLPLLMNEGIAPYLIDLSDQVTAETDFFECDILVISIPPKTRSGKGDEYIPKLQRAIAAIEQHQVRKVILISSTGVYADQNCELNELSDPKPESASARILYDAELLFKLNQKIDCTIIRFGGLIGPGREPGRFFAGKTNIPNGLAPVNMIHLDDCINLTLAVIEKDAFGYLFNACTPHHPTKSWFYTRASEKAGYPLPAFLPELKEWKIINSINTTTVLNYTYQINNWGTWLA